MGEDPTPATANDLSTIRGIQATFAASERPIEVSGVVSRVVKLEAGGFEIEVVDQPGFSEPHLDCVTKTTGDLVPWTKGKLTGPGYAQVVDCTAAVAP